MIYRGGDFYQTKDKPDDTGSVFKIIYDIFMILWFDIFYAWNANACHLGILSSNFF